MMPEVFDRFFAQFGKKSSDYLKFISFEPQYRMFFADKTHVDITSDLQQIKKTFEAIESGSGSRLDEYLRQAEIKYRIALDHVLYRNMDSIFDFITWDMMRLGPKLGATESMQKYVAKFFKSEKLQQIIEYTLVFLGGAPSNTPALYSLMTHVDFNLGVLYPLGGLNAVAKAIAKLAKEQGVIIKLNEPVQEILTKGRSVVGLRTKKKSYEFDAIVSNADYAHTETLLRDPGLRQYSPRYWEKRTLAPSAFILYLGVKGKIPELAHHNLVFGKNWLDHFEEIFARPDWPQDPSIYICNPNKTEPGLAPKNHENLFVLVPVASKLPENKRQRERYANFVIEYLERQLQIPLKERLVVKDIFSSTEFAKRYNSYGGSALGLAHTLFQTAIWRPPNQSRKVKNLFFAGASTVPGIGVPISLISAELARDRV